MHVCGEACAIALSAGHDNVVFVAVVACRAEAHLSSDILL